MSTEQKHAKYEQSCTGRRYSPERQLAVIRPSVTKHPGGDAPRWQQLPILNDSEPAERRLPRGVPAQLRGYRGAAAAAASAGQRAVDRKSAHLGHFKGKRVGIGRV